MKTIKIYENDFTEEWVLVTTNTDGLKDYEYFETKEDAEEASNETNKKP